jgi:hypothetical protein
MASTLNAVPMFTTNAFEWRWHSDSVHDQAKFFHNLNNGLVVPWFDDFTQENKESNYDLTDSVHQSSSTFRTDAGALTQGSLFYSSWNMSYGNDMQWGVYAVGDDDSKTKVDWMDPFHVYSPDSGLDHRQSYYFGNTRKYVDEDGNQTEKSVHSSLKNVLALYWMWTRTSTSYYCTISKIALEYEDENGEVYVLIPPQVMFDNEDKSSGKFYAPMAKKPTGSTKQLLRGVALDPKQATFVVENELYFKGIHIQVNRETPSKAGTNTPHGLFWSFTPWILGDTKPRFDDGYCLSTWDLWAVRDKDSTECSDFISDWWTDKGLQERERYFQDSNNINTGKILVKTRSNDRSSTIYTDELLEIKPVPLVDNGKAIRVNSKWHKWDNISDEEEL